MKRLGRNIVANIFSNIWSTALSLLLVPVYINFLGIESYGLIGFYASFIAVLSVLDVGISATAGREIAWMNAREDERDKVPSLMRSLEIVYAGTILAIGIVLLILAWKWGDTWFVSEVLSPEVLRQAMMLMALSLIVQVPSGLYIGGLMGLQEQVKCSGYLALFGTIRGIGAVLVLWLIDCDIRLFFIWNILVNILQIIVLRWVLWKFVKIESQEASFSKELLYSLRHFAGGMVLVSFLGILLCQCDKMILSRTTSLEALGSYMVAWTISSGLSRIATPLIQAFQPKFTELVSMQCDFELLKHLRIASQLMSLLMVLPTALVAFFAKDILFAWTRNASVAQDASIVLAILIWGTLLTSCAYPYLSLLYSQKRINLVIWISFVGLLLFFPLCVYVTITNGIKGAALCWAGMGLAYYFIYSFYVLKTMQYVLSSKDALWIIVSDFIKPVLVVFSVVWLGSVLLSDFVHGLWSLSLVLIIITLFSASFGLAVSSTLKQILFKCLKKA